MVSLVALVTAAFTLCSTSHASPVQSEQHTLLTRAKSNFNWTLSTDFFNTTDLAWQVQPYVANGYIGARLPVEGIGYRAFEPIGVQNGTDGWPLFPHRVTASSIAGFFDVQYNTTGTNFEQKGGEQVVSLLPTWNTLLFTLAATDSAAEATYGVGVNASAVSNYTQSLSIRNGVVNTALTWTPPQHDPIDISITVVAHRKRPNLALVRYDVSGLKKNQQIFVTDVLDGAGADRVQAEAAGVGNDTNVIWSSVQPAGVSNVTAWEFSAFSLLSKSSSSVNSTLSKVAVPSSAQALFNASSPATSSQTFNLTAPSSGRVSVYKAVSLASSDAFSPNERKVALQTALQARKAGWEALLEEHDQEWENIWNDGGDIVLHGDSEVEHELWRNARASLFHILANARRGSEGKGLGDNSIAPAGLTSQSYAGGIFWDAELWMYPSLLSLQPDFAESINNYRIKNFGAAKQNSIATNSSGALYPWVSFRYGNATGIGPTFDYEYHLNNDIALAMWQYYQTTKNETWLKDEGYPVLRAVSDFWANHVVKGDDGFYHTLNETGPDEYSNHKDDSAFTNAGVEITFNNTRAAAKILGDKVPSNWSVIADQLFYNYTNGILVEFTDFNASTPVKQADVTLTTYPLEYETENPHDDLTFYSGATSPNGPAMTYSSFSVNAAQLAPHGCESWAFLLASNQPYVREPFAQFSEQSNDIYSLNGGTNPAFTFLTGHGGYLQTFTHGFTGYRVRLDNFYLDPSLPPQLKGGFTVQGMRWQGYRFDVTVSAKETIISRTDKVKSKAPVRIGKRNAKAGLYKLAAGQKITVPTTRVDSKPAIAGNVASCRTATSNTTWVPGQIPQAAFDSSNATLWQPSTQEPTELTVDLGTARSLKKLHLAFGKNPPLSVSVWTGNDPSKLKEVVPSTSVAISAPFNAEEAAIVRIAETNTTSIALPNGSQKARYVRLVVSGAATPDQFGHGATVTEVAVF